MPRVFRQQYTRPIPEDAQRVTIKNKKGEDVPAVRFRGPDGKTTTAPITTKGKNAGKLCRVVSPTWYGMVNGVKTPLCTNKAAAEQMLAQLIREAEQNKALGLDEQILDARKKPLADHPADFRRTLEAQGNAPRYVETVNSRLTDLLDGCKFVFPPDLSASRVMEWLADLRRSGRKRIDLEPGKEGPLPPVRHGLRDRVPRVGAGQLDPGFLRPGGRPADRYPGGPGLQEPKNQGAAPAGGPGRPAAGLPARPAGRTTNLAGDLGQPARCGRHASDGPGCSRHPLCCRWAGWAPPCRLSRTEAQLLDPGRPGRHRPADFARAGRALRLEANRSLLPPPAIRPGRGRREATPALA